MTTSEMLSASATFKASQVFMYLKSFSSFFLPYLHLLFSKIANTCASFYCPHFDFQHLLYTA